jgi:hypothetical protein
MEALCPACTVGPAGIEGHQDLRVRSLGENAMGFTCRTCHALWSRTYSTHGSFFWLRRAAPGADVGMSLPSSGPPQGPANAPMNSAHGSAEHWLAIQASWKQPRRYPA